MSYSQDRYADRDDGNDNVLLEDDDMGDGGGGGDDDDGNDKEGNDMDNFKGIYFNEEPGRKWHDPVTGAHFNFDDM